MQPVETNKNLEQKLQTSNKNVQSLQNRGVTRDYVNPHAPIVGQTVIPQTPITRDSNNRNFLNLSTPSTHNVQSKPETNNRGTVRDYVNPSATLINPNVNSKAGPSTPHPNVPNSYVPAVNPSRSNTNLRDYVAPSRPSQENLKPNFPALPTPPGSQIPIHSEVIQPPSGSTIQTSYANKVVGGITTKSPLVIPKIPSTGPFNSGSSTTEKPEDGPTDNELREFSEALLKKDVNNAAKYVTINIQGKTTSSSKNDEAPQR